MYLPKSKYQVKESGGQFMYNDTKQIYIGPYIEMSDGMLATGTSISQGLPYGRKIIPTIHEVDKKAQVLYKGRYNNLEKDIYEFHTEVKKVIFTKPLPTSKDYEKGNFKRYFAKRKNSDASYIEIDKKTHKNLKSKSSEYDWHLYKVGNLDWYLGENSVNSNSMSIRIKSFTFPYLGLLFSNLQEYFKPSIFESSVINKTQPQKKALAMSKFQTEINKSNKNQKLRYKERLLKKRKQENINLPSSNAATPITLNTNTPSSGGGGGGY